MTYLNPQQTINYGFLVSEVLKYFAASYSLADLFNGLIYIIYVFLQFFPLAYLEHDTFFTRLQLSITFVELSDIYIHFAFKFSHTYFASVSKRKGKVVFTFRRTGLLVSRRLLLSFNLFFI